ncbi:MAG TPA: DUF4340 domain-containing protein [Candidatus Ozemobacteraceae bacterium]|nr:DUF4340 domain-containing protein [Candidatus Ozemobacteraceae bacterium]
MKKRFFTTGLAIVVFILLFLYANIYEVDIIPEPGKDKPVQLAATANAEVKALTWQTGSGPEIRIESQTSGTERNWAVVKPRAYRADRDVAAGIVQTFSDLQSELTIVATETVSYGFGSDSLSLVIETGSGTTALLLGHDAPVGGSVYMQKRGDPNVYVVTNAVAPAFRKTLEDLRDKAIFTENFTDVASVTVIAGSATIELGRTPTGWDMLAPSKMPADAAEVSSLIYGIHDLKADRFLAETTPESIETSFDKPEYKVVLRTANGTGYEFLVAREEGGMARVRRSGAGDTFLVNASTLAPLRKDFNALRSKDLPQIPSFEVKRLEVRVGTETYELSLASDAWKCGDRPVDKSRVEQVVQGYSTGRIQEFLPADAAKDHGLADPKACDRLLLASDKTERVVLFGAVEGPAMTARVEGEDELYRLSTALHDAVKALADHLRTRPEPAAPAPSAPAPAPAPAPGGNK